MRVTGKLVVATSTTPSWPGLPPSTTGVWPTASRPPADGAEARELEPHVSAVAAIHVAQTGVIDYRAVSRVLVRRLADAGAPCCPAPRSSAGART